ncbi:MAG: diguanylate cyclase [Gallionella sp.]|nr:diguanylate cyclase [Gallionella sp.]
MSKARSNIRRAALASLTLTIMLTGAMIWMVAGTLTRLSANTDRLTNSNTVVNVLDALIAHMIDVETGERGYIITGNDDYLVPHERGLAMVYRQRDELVRLLAGDPSEQDRLANLSMRLDAKVAVSQANVQARRHGFEAARARVSEGAGKREMNSLRETLGEISRAQTERRNVLRSQRDAMMDELRRNMIIAAVLFVALLGYLHFYLLRMVGLMHETEQQMAHLASHDVLTGLPNRRLMLEHLDRAVQRCVRHKKSMALLFMDLNGFKPVNDKYGHEAGDEVLKQVAQRLSGTIRASDMVARLGGDEFVVLVEDITDKDGVCDIVRKITAEIERPFRLTEGSDVTISASIGVAIYPRDGEDTETLLRNADTAMYEAKRNQSNCYCREQMQLRRCMLRDDGAGK